MDATNPGGCWYPYDTQSNNDNGLDHQFTYFDTNSTYYNPTPKTVWNATQNIYENLPVFQYSAPFPQMCDTYSWAPEALYESPVCPEVLPQEEQQKTNLMMGNIWNQEQQKTNHMMGNLWNVAFDFAENFLAQMVLDQSKPKTSKEALSKSKLNPNAKEFTPMLKTDKLVQKEKETCQDSESNGSKEKNNNLVSKENEVSPTIQITDTPTDEPRESNENEEHVRSLTRISTRKQTPWKKDPEILFGDKDGTFLSVSIESGTRFFGDDCSIDSLCGRRVNNISESSDDFRIEFDGDYNSNCDTANLDKNYVHCFQFEESELSSDDEDDWDEDDDFDSAGGSGLCIELDEEESKELMMPTFSQQLLDSNLVSRTSVEGHPSGNKNCPCKVAHANKQWTDQFSSNGDSEELNPQPPSYEPDTFSSCSCILADVNKRWTDQFASAEFVVTECEPKAVIIIPLLSKCCGEKRKPKSVCWKPEKDWQVILEPKEMMNDLKEARISDFERRQAEKERLERLFSPILTAEHRDRVLKRMQKES